MASPIELLKIDGERLDARVEGNLAGGELLRTMDGASTLTLEIHDPQGEILETGVLTKRKSRGDTFGDAAWTRLGKVQCSLDGAFFRISGVSKTGSMLTLTFEDEIVALLRSHTRLVRDSRADETRAGFIRYRLIAAVKERHIISWIPALGRTHERIAKPEAALTKIGQAGIPSGSHVQVKGNRISKEQRKNLNAALDVAAEENASERATLALLVAIIQESGALNLTYGDRDSEGILQLRVGIHGASNANSVERSVRLFLTRGFWGKGGAIALAGQHSTWKVTKIAQFVQGSGVPDGYDPWVAEAKAILEAYGGTGQNVTTRESYVFKAGKGVPNRANYWAAILDLAEQVGWRAFTANNVFFYAADKDLMRAQPAMTVAEQPSSKDLARGVQYVGNIDFDWHYNKPVGEVTFTVPADRWLAYPGSVAAIEGLGPCEGRWLNWQFRQGLDSSMMDITLHRPAPAKPEPAPDIRPSTLSAPDDTLGGNGPGARLLRWAKTQLGTTEGSAKQVKWAQSLGFSPSLPWCSIFLAYGLKTVAPEIDLPTNPAYSGAWLNWAGGERVGKNNVKPGDLLIFDWGDGGDKDHIAISAGHGQHIGGNQGTVGGGQVTKGPDIKSAIVGVIRIKT